MQTLATQDAVQFFQCVWGENSITVVILIKSEQKECSDSDGHQGAEDAGKEGSWPQEGKRWPEINVFRVKHMWSQWNGLGGELEENLMTCYTQREAKRLSIMFAFFWSPKIYCCSKVCGCKTMFLKEVFYAHQCFILRDSSAKWKFGHCLLTFVSFQTC